MYTRERVLYNYCNYDTNIKNNHRSPVFFLKDDSNYIIIIEPYIQWKIVSYLVLEKWCLDCMYIHLSNVDKKNLGNFRFRTCAIHTISGHLIESS